eukprot:c28127_g1_i2 orf=394-2814(-)
MGLSQNSAAKSFPAHKPIRPVEVEIAEECGGGENWYTSAGFVSVDKLSGGKEEDGEKCAGQRQREETSFGHNQSSGSDGCKGSVSRHNGGRDHGSKVAQPLGKVSAADRKHRRDGGRLKKEFTKADSSTRCGKTGKKCATSGGIGGVNGGAVRGGAGNKGWSSKADGGTTGGMHSSSEAGREPDGSTLKSILGDSALEGVKYASKRLFECSSRKLCVWYISCRGQLDCFWSQQKPTMERIRRTVLQVRDKVVPVVKAAVCGTSSFQSFVKRVWPPLSVCLLFFARVLLTLGLMWLDCCVRGLSSLFRLGAASLFLLMCCTALNLSLLVGFLKFLIAVVTTVAAAFFLGYTFAFSVMSIFGVIVLWMYGSFWITGSFILVGGVLFITDHSRFAIFITMVYSAASAKRNGGWLGLFLCANFAFILSDFTTYFLRSNASDNTQKDFNESMQGQSFSTNRTQTGSPGKGSGAECDASFDEYSKTSETSRMPGCASTSGASDGDATLAKEEVSRLLSCKDYFSMLGLARFQEIDPSVLRREYRKKAMLVHPDKNMGNQSAEEAFKCLQNAYEVLLDSAKRKAYEEELKREEVIMALKRFWSDAHQNGRYGPTEERDKRSENEGEASANSRRIACRNCNKMHAWIYNERSKSRARWCQDCRDYHQAKDGDGWVEQSGQSFLFGIFQKVDVPHAYACADGKIYEVTDWAKCQGMMKCPPNTHKPTFHVSTSGNPRNKSGGSRTSKAPVENSSDNFSFGNLDENMTEQEFFEWLENAMASGVFSDANGAPSQQGAKSGNRANMSRKKRKGKKQW